MCRLRDDDRCAAAGQTMLPGFRRCIRWLFSGIYPVNSADYEHLKSALAKIEFERFGVSVSGESSAALGFGFRCGLPRTAAFGDRAGTVARRQFDMDIIATYPSVIYQVLKTNGEVLQVDNPAFLPEPVTGGPHRKSVREGVRDLPERKHRRPDAKSSWKKTRRGEEDRFDRHAPGDVDGVDAAERKSLWTSTTRSKASRAVTVRSITSTLVTGKAT